MLCFVTRISVLCNLVCALDKEETTEAIFYRRTTEGNRRTNAGPCQMSAGASDTATHALVLLITLA